MRAIAPVILQADAVTKRFGTVIALDGVSFSTVKGEIVSLLGPSGCGKTTLLRTIAGFNDPDSGRIVIGGAEMNGRRPYERNVGLMFQDYALFPHMSVFDNIAYGLRRRGESHQRVQARVGHLLDLIRLGEFAPRRPDQLSGGQQQRVALARALANEPDVVLLDEPLSALDAKLRTELRFELKKILKAAEATVIVVTHDQVEALSLGDRVLVMSKGRIVQEGDPYSIYLRPNSHFVAEFLGRLNWLGGVRDITGGVLRIELGNGPAIEVHSNETTGRRVRIGVRPERLRFTPGLEGCWNRLPGTVLATACVGPELHVELRLTDGSEIFAVAQNLGTGVPAVGHSIELFFQPQDCILVPADEQH